MHPDLFYKRIRKTTQNAKAYFNFAKAKSFFAKAKIKYAKANLFFAKAKIIFVKANYLVFLYIGGCF